MNILVVAAHPDDEILGCGGTMNRFRREGHKVDVLIITDGRNTAIDQKLDTLPIVDIIKRVEDAVDAYKPDLVFTPYLHDLNRDHQVVAEATLVACRPHLNIKELYHYEILSSTELATQAFWPDTFSVITEEDLAFKKKIMSTVYAKELREAPHPRSLEGIEAQARMRGIQVASEFAEAFILVRRVL